MTRRTARFLLPALLATVALVATGCGGLLTGSGVSSTPPVSTSSVETALAELCNQGDYLSCSHLYSITPVGSPMEEYGASCGGRRAPSGRPCSEEPEGRAQLQALTENCVAGDLAACLRVYISSPVGSVEESIAEGCGRQEDGATISTLASCIVDAAPSEEVAAQGCEQGSGLACDQLYAISAPDSELEEYGASCGGRFPGVDRNEVWCSQLLG